MLAPAITPRQPSSARITDVDAWTILDSRGRPTIRVRVECENGIAAIGDAPAGASRGSQEAMELRDGGTRWSSQGVDKAIAAAREDLARAILGLDSREQHEVDRALRDADGTPTLGRLGGNAIVAVSAAVARCGAAALGIPLYRHLAIEGSFVPPVPLMNVLNGGAHADGGLRLQECMIVPHGPPTVAERVRCGAEVYAALRTMLQERNLSTAVGDEGGFVVKGVGVDAALTLLEEAIGRAGYRPGDDVSLAIDAAANAFFKDGFYEPEMGQRMQPAALVDWWAGLIERHPITILEDPHAEGDTAGWQLVTEKLGSRVLIVGDDIFATNAGIIRQAIADGVGNAALIKPNQAGTVSATLEAVRVARDAGYDIILSHRSGETCDTLVADLAWATHAAFLKAGAPARAERTEKYNRLLEIERERSS